MKEAKRAFDVAKEEATTEQARLKEKARKSEMTASEIEEEQADIEATVAKTKANALDDRPNKTM